ncbi:MAG: hypothetical protein JWQ71_470 [Pedosphaera sp.]|nr:hypothetical protein [Pedosphaera sp.]
MTKHFILACLLMAALCLPSRASFVLSSGGKARCVIVQSTNATQPEIYAAKDLTQILEQITDAKFSLLSTHATGKQLCIIVGPGPAASSLFPEIDFTKFGPEEFVMRIKGRHLLLAGGRPRGTMYAVNRFLQEQCGVRWWTPWTTNIPHQANLRIGKLDVHIKPVFEYRGPYWFSGFEPAWKAHNCVNNESHEIPKELGGSITYKGYCHTFYPLVPPAKYFATHSEWYCLVNGQRTHDNAQLCLTNPKLRDFMVERVKEWLRESPDASIISVTQNDCDGHCECPDCKALDDAEGSHSGTMLSFANYIAEKIEPEFPNVAVDTFAYQYTRKPPKTLKARHNVIVRLCSIECNFRQPLDHPVNAAFLSDLEQWSKISSRLYIWDYVTDFSHYIYPHPNWFVLGPNIRTFQKYGVKGVFEEGAYASHGAEMAELRAWVLAQLMWNPGLDDRALIQEFLNGYYGKAAAKPIRQYLELLHQNSKDYFLACYMRKDPPYLRFDTLAPAEKLWQEAEKLAATDSEKLQRIRIAHLPLRCAWLSCWPALRREAWEKNQAWPLSESRKAVADEWREVANGQPGKDWTVVRTMNEHGQSVDDFLKGVADDIPDTNGPPPPKRLLKAKPPADLEGIDPKKCIDLQENLAGLYKPGKYAEIRPDTAASDLRTVWLPPNHQEWAFRLSGTSLPAKAKNGKWKVYAVIRVEKRSNAAPETPAFGVGVFNNKSRSYPAEMKVKIGDASEAYHSYLLGTVELNSDCDIWVAPPGNKEIKALYVDRIYLVPAS